MKRSHNVTAFGKFALVAATLVLTAISAYAQSSQLLVIEAHQFYPAGGYPSAVANQTIPAGFQQIIFQADSGQAITGQLTIRCRGGSEYRNVGLSYSGYTSSVRNPCGATNLVNFDLYLSSPNMTGRYDRIRVYGSGQILNPPPPPVYYGDLLATIDFNRFYPAQGYMAVGSQYIASGYQLYRFISTDRFSPVSGRLTIRCGNGKEFRNVAISPAGNGSIFSNPCASLNIKNIDIYLSSPRVGAGTYGQLQIFGQR